MQFLTTAECEAWSARCGGQTAVDLRMDGTIETRPAAQLYWVARHAYSWVRDVSFQDTLVWVYEHGIWPSEQLLLYQMLRAQHGNRQTVAQTPGHWLLRHEVEEGIALLFLCLMHGWGVRVMGDTYPRTVEIDHDGLVTVQAVTDSDAAEIIARLAR